MNILADFCKVTGAESGKPKLEVNSWQKEKKWVCEWHNYVCIDKLD